MTEETAHSVIARILDLGYINDRDYALRRARLLAEKGHGDFSLRTLLEGLEIPHNIVDDVIKKVSMENPEEERISMLIQKKKDKDREKLIRFLAGRGFPFDKILSTLGGDEK